jgi:hypothetical protein
MKPNGNVLSIARRKITRVLKAKTKTAVTVTAAAVSDGYY